MELVLSEIKRYLSHNQKDPEQDFSLYEMMACHKENVMMWSLVPNCHKNGFICDMGVDGFNPETKKAVQVKMHQKSSITHSKLATFHTFATF